MRHTFGGDLSAYTLGLGDDDVFTAGGIGGKPAIIVGGQPVTFWNAQYNGEQYTNLLHATTGGPDDPGGTVVTTLYTSGGADGDPPYGCIPMILGPDNVTVMWAQVGSGTGGSAAGSTAADGSSTDTGADTGMVDDSDNDIDTGDDDPADDTGDDAGDGGAGDGGTGDDTGDDGSDDGGTGTDTSASGTSRRLLIVASTAGLQLEQDLQVFTEAIEPRIEDLEQQAQDSDTHLQLHDNQIAALQAGGGSGAGSAGVTTGTTAQRGPASLGALYLDTQLNRLWIAVATAAGDAAVWAPMPGSQVFIARQSIQQPMPEQNLYPLSLDTIDFDLLGGSWDAGTKTRFCPKVPGFYQLTGSISFSGNEQATANSCRYVAWRFNGSNVPPASTSVFLGSTSYTTVVPARTFSWYFDGVSDYAELCGYHNAGPVNLSTAVTSWGQSSMSAMYQGGSEEDQ